MKTMRFTTLAIPVALAISLMTPMASFAFSGYIISISRSNFTANTTSDVYVKVKNTGAQVNFAVECTNAPSGWRADDNEIDFDNYIMKNVGAGATVDFGPFKVTASSAGSATLHWTLQSEYYLSWTMLDQEYQTVSATAPDTTPPTTPGTPDLAAADDSGQYNNDNITMYSSGLTFSWTTSTDSGGSGLAGYEWKLDKGNWTWGLCIHNFGL